MTHQNHGQPVLKVESSPLMTSQNSEQLRSELRAALVAPNRHISADNVHGGTEHRPIRKTSTILNWLAYDSPHSLVAIVQADQARNQEDHPADNNNANDQQQQPPDGSEPSRSNIDFEAVRNNISNTIGWMVTTFSLLWQYKLFRIVFFIMSVYYGLGFLERWAVALTAAFVRWTWPPVHFMLGSSRGTLHFLTDWFAWMDDFLSSWVCDMATRYCHHYNVMCECRCSFVSNTQRAAFFGRRF